MIYLIRHAKVLHKWPKCTSSLEFSDNVVQYDLAPIEQIPIHVINDINSRVPENFELFTSQLSRTINTKNQLFNFKQAIELPQLNEVSLTPYKNSVKSIRTWRWFLFGRILWALNPEQRHRVSRQFEQIIELISKPEHAVLIGHRFSFICLLFFIKRRGYKFTMDNKSIKNLDLIICRSTK